MPFDRPALKEIIDRLEASVRSELGVGPLLARSLLKALVRGLAGVGHLEHGHLAYIEKQVIPTGKTGEHLGTWASIFGITRKAASFATGTGTFLGTDGTAIPLGTILRRSDGQTYKTTAVGTIASGTADVALEAVTAGADANAAGPATLSLASPVNGLGATITSTAGLSGGADEETDAALRDRLLDRLQSPPQGGAAADYVAWALEVPGVTRAWALPLNRGAGTVDLTFAEDAGATAPVPGSALVDLVQDKIDLERPVTADAVVFAPTAVALDPDITLTPNTTEAQASVEAALEDLLRREGGAGETLLLSHIREAISLAVGETNHVLNSPVADVVYTASQIGKLGSITWS